jgi:hypothetical protein
MANKNIVRNAQICLALVMLLATSWSTSAIAQSSTITGSRGSILATAYSEFADDSNISIQAKEDTELNLRLQAVFREELLQSGYRVPSDAQLVLTFSMVIESDALSAGRVAVSGQGGNREPLDAEVTIKVEKSKSGLRKKTRYRLEANLIDNNTKPIWKGVATITLDAGSDRTQISESMVRSLMATLRYNGTQ